MTEVSIEGMNKVLGGKLRSKVCGHSTIHNGKPKFYVMIEKMRTYIEDNLTDPNLSLKQISHHFDIHPCQFSRVFKAGTEEKFIDYVTRLRIELSKEKLAQSCDTIQDIAEQVGYTHVISFIRVFKKNEHATPGEYRKKVQMES
jgi:two-component system response regulator YesN